MIQIRSLWILEFILKAGNDINIGDKMSDKDKVIEAFKNSEEPLNATKVSEISGVEKKEVDKIMKELKKDETIVSPKRCYWTLADK